MSFKMTSASTKNIYSNYLKEKLKSNNNSSSEIYIRDCKPSGFHNLPTNVLMTIFKHITETELRNSIIPVCYKWRQVALLPEFWNIIKFKGFHVPSNFICQQLRLFSNLQHIQLINIDDAATVIRQICRCNTEIVTISIKYCRNDKYDNKIPERVLRNLIATCKKLREINIKGTLFSGNIFFLEVAILPLLRSLDLSKNDLLTTKNIFDFILNCENLEEFKLSHRSKNQQITDNDVEFLIKNLKSSLISITFDMTELTKISYQALLDCEKLEKLFLYNTSNMSAETFENIWTKLPNLKHLKIHRSQINPCDFQGYFGDSNLVFCNLVTLNLKGSWKLNSTGIETITLYCPNLQKIILKCCKNLNDISCLGQNCKNLRILNIAFCLKLSDQNIFSVLTALKNLQNFYIDINRNKVIDFVPKNYPNIVIWVFFSEFNNNKRKMPF